MTTYVVRMKEGKEFVGIYAARNQPSLFWLVDQLCDPYACEYSKLSVGGLHFIGKCSKFITLDNQTEKEIEQGIELNGPEFTEEMLTFAGKWKELTEDYYD